MDTWLAGAIGELTSAADYRAGKTLIFVVFDESSAKTTTLVPAIALAGGIQPVRDGTPYGRGGAEPAERNSGASPKGDTVVGPSTGSVRTSANP